MDFNFLQDIKKAKLFGHPIHSMLVHFPSALFPVSVLFDLIAFALKDKTFAIVAFYTLLAGLVGGIFAAIFGAIDFYRLPVTHPAWRKAAWHATLNILWLSLFTILLGLRTQYYPAIELATPAELIIAIIGILGLVFSNFLGGDLIFRHKIGIHEEKK